MSTEYLLYEKRGAALVINEKSSTLSLAVKLLGGNSIPATRYIPPKELMKIFLEGIKTCSYYMDSKTFKETLATLEDYSYE